MAERQLEGATPERCVREDSRPDLRAQLTAPHQLPADSCMTPLRSIHITGQRFDTLLWKWLEHRSEYQFEVCSNLS